MKKTLYILSFLSLCLCAVHSHAQELMMLYRDQRIDLTQSTKRYSEIGFDTENRMLRSYLTNPAYERIVALDSTILKKSYVGVNASRGDLSGDYLLSEGNVSQNYSIDGFGSMSLRGEGTLYGHIQFSQGVDRSISWNAIRYSELYSPYVTTDSLGGDVNYDFYSIVGGYAFNKGCWNYGVEMSFDGEQAHRMTDPRLKNITSWVTAKVGVGYQGSRSTTLLSASYQRNKQHQTMRYWRPGQQERIFVCNGLGLYDTQYSLVVMGYSRMYYMWRMDANLNHTHQLGDRTSLSVGVGYDQYRVSTEETSVRNLFNATTRRVTPKLELVQNYSWGKQILYGELNHQSRAGEENIYETYLSDELNFVYDFRLISTRYNYFAENTDALLQFKTFWNVGSSGSSFSGLLGGYFSNRQERYTTRDFFVQNQWVEPHVGVGYDFRSTRNTLSLSMVYSQKFILEGVYDVDISRGANIEYLDFQHSFSPYAFYSSEYGSLRFSATYIHNLRRFSLGVRAEGMMRNGSRAEGVEYTGDIGFESSAPLLSKTVDRYIENYGRVSVFVLF